MKILPGSTDSRLASDAECGGEPTSQETAKAAASVVRVAGALPANCRLHAEAIFWTASDWPTLADAFAADPSPCADYYISLPPLAADKKRLRVLQDDLIRAHGPRIHPVAEVTLGGATGWANWVTGAPGRTWFDAGVEFRNRMADAGYRFDLGETWFLNEFDRSTRLDQPPYTRAAMRDLLRGLYDGGGTLTPVTGIVEIGIVYTHQNIPDVAQYKEDTKIWLEDAAFWQDVGPKIRFLAKETYPDGRFWGVAGSSRKRASRAPDAVHGALPQPCRSGAARTRRSARVPEPCVPLAGKRDLERQAPESFTPPFSAGHGWTLELSLDEMLHFVSEQAYAIRHFAGSHPQGAPAGRLGFTWQPTNNATSQRGQLPGPEFEAAKQAIAARLASAIHYAYRQGGASPEGACAPPDSGEDWCLGGDVPGATFTDAWQAFESWG